MARKDRQGMCVDRVIAADRKIHSARLARAENPRNAPKRLAMRPGASSHPFKMAMETGKLWKPGRLLTVRFLDGSSTQKDGVEHFARIWERYADIRFDFVNEGDATIRVSFVADKDSWSAIGTDCLVERDFPRDEATMNYDWLRNGTNETEYRRVVEHEFGHALGAIHEHQNPKQGIEWDLPKVYEYFSGPPNNWSKRDIDYNVIQKYSVDQINGSAYDKRSIMLYAFPPELILNGVPAPMNTQISPGDKTFVGTIYPKKAKARRRSRKG